MELTKIVDKLFPAIQVSRRQAYTAATVVSAAASMSFGSSYSHNHEIGYFIAQVGFGLLAIYNSVRISRGN